MTPRELIDAILSRDRQRQAAAYTTLRRLTRHCGAPGLREASRSDLDDAVGTFLIYLLEDRNRVALASIRSTRGMKTAIRRALARKRGDSVEDRPDALQEHLRAKVVEVLREDGRFCREEGKGYRRYRLASAPVNPPARRPAFEVVRDGLPSLPGRYAVTQANHLPEVAGKRDLAEQLRRILEAHGNEPLSAGYLARVCWETLRPKPPETAFEDFDDDAPRREDAKRAEDDQERLLSGIDAAPETEVEATAWRVVARLDGQLLQAVWLRYCAPEGRLGFEEIGERLGVSKSTADNLVGDKRGKFGNILKEEAEHAKLHAADWGRVLTKVLEIVRAGGFKRGGDST